MSEAKPPRRRGPRGTRAEIEAVVSSAEAAGHEVDLEQQASVGHIARALGEISVGEASAHIDSRVAFVERQVERLLARREEADRGLQAELAVMRARVEDALQAVTATAEEQRAGWGALERRLSTMLADSERRGAAIAESLREELASRLHATTTKFDRTESRLRGEIGALAQDAEERHRAASEAAARTAAAFERRMAKARSELAAMLRQVLGEVEARRASGEQALRADLSTLGTGLGEDVAARLDAATRSLWAELEARIAEVRRDVAESEGEIRRTVESIHESARSLSSVLEERLALVDRRFEERSSALEQRGLMLERELRDRATRVDESLSGLEQRVEGGLRQSEALRDDAVARERVLDERVRQGLTSMEQRLDGLLEDVRGEVATALEGGRRELDGRLGEWAAGLRLDVQRAREAAEELGSQSDRARDAVRRELLDRIRSSEEKAAGAAVHLESMLREQRRQLVSDEEEWSGELDSLAEAVATLRLRVEDMIGRVASVETRWAGDRGSREAMLEGLVHRVSLIEERLREGGQELLARHATRLEMLERRVESAADGEADVEVQRGAIEYVRRKLLQLAGRVDRIEGGAAGGVFEIEAEGQAMPPASPASQVGRGEDAPEMPAATPVAEDEVVEEFRAMAAARFAEPAVESGALPETAPEPEPEARLPDAGGFSDAEVVAELVTGSDPEPEPADEASDAEDPPMDEAYVPEWPEPGPPATPMHDGPSGAHLVAEEEAPGQDEASQTAAGDVDDEGDPSAGELDPRTPSAPRTVLPPTILPQRRRGRWG